MRLQAFENIHIEPIQQRPRASQARWLPYAQKLVLRFIGKFHFQQLLWLLHRVIQQALVEARLQSRRCLHLDFVVHEFLFEYSTILETLPIFVLASANTLAFM